MPQNRPRLLSTGHRGSHGCPLETQNPVKKESDLRNLKWLSPGTVSLWIRKAGKPSAGRFVFVLTSIVFPLKAPGPGDSNSL